MRRYWPIVGLVIFLVFAVSTAFGASVQEVFKAAQEFQKEKKYDQAIGEYQKVVKLLVQAGNKPVAQQVQMNIGVLYFIQSKFDKAVEAYQTALKLHAEPKAEFRLKLERNLASAHFKAGNVAQAVRLRESILADKTLDPKLKPFLWAELAAAYRASEVYSQAVRAYKEALRGLPPAENTETRALLLTSLGQAQSRLGLFDEAIGNLKQANELAKQLDKPRTVAESHSNLGVVYWDMGHYNAALKQLDQAWRSKSPPASRRTWGLI